MIADFFNLNPNLIKPAKMSELHWKAMRPKDSSLNTAKSLNTLGETKPLTLQEAFKVMKLEKSVYEGLIDKYTIA